MKPPFKILEHPADMGIEAHGCSMQEIFRHAAQGLISVIAGTSLIGKEEQRTISITAIDRENMMVRWLTEILYLYDAEQFLTANVTFEVLTDTSLKAVLIGEPYHASKHQLHHDVKAITYHQLEVKEHNKNWMTRVYLDV